MIYEYDVVTLDLDEDQKQAIQMGIGKIEHLNSLIKKMVNSKGKEGWEPLYPFSVPQL